MRRVGLDLRLALILPLTRCKVPEEIVVIAIRPSSDHQAKASALKKRKNIAPTESFESPDDPAEPLDDLDDLFDISHLPPSTSTSSSTSRAELVAYLRNTLALGPKERKTAVSSEIRLDVLARIVELSGEANADAGGERRVRDVQELRGVLKGWRMLGLRVRQEVGEAVVGEYFVR